MTDEALKSLAEEFLSDVEEIAAELSDGTVPEEDLISEGYVGLMEGLKSFDAGDPELMPMNMTETVRSAVRSAILSAIDRSREYEKTGELLVAQVELLRKSIDRLTEELGTKPNIDEIANDMQISQDKVLEIIKLTGPDVSDEALTGVQKL